MIYHSTRDITLEINAADAIVKGLSSDGGLFVPDEIPKLSMDEIVSLGELLYPDRATEILGLYLTDFRKNEIKECTQKAYTKEKFETESIAPIYKLNDQTYILELWHGPTCAFKDMALQILPHLLTVSMEKTGVDKEVAILVATSGDTGKAALEGFKNVPGTKIFVFYPTGGVSLMQKLQMQTQEGENVGVCAIEGNFDDAQNGVKEIFKDRAYNMELKSSGIELSSANSINWGRLVPQIVYYVSSYAELIKNEEISCGEKINICVPTGNFGNILAAYYAMEMGVPVNKLICASNSNNVLTEFIRTGVYNRNREFVTTISPSMDILISSNLERFLFHASGNDSELVRELMNELSETGQYEIPDRIKTKLADIFYAAYCDDKFTIRTIADIERNYSYVMDPHTAVAQNVYEQYVAQTHDATKTIIASTASPFKFSGSVVEAIAGAEETEKTETEFELLDKLSELSGQKPPKSLSDLLDKEIRFDGVCKKDDMKTVVDTFLR
ncbi:MAG: threonine synthase [Bacillota bacterium]|nr:threonine synthase [Bacillota bacterium]